MRTRRLQWASTAIAIGAALFSGTAPAQSAAEFPARPIRVLVSAPPGGTTDIVARMYATRLGEILNQHIIVDNRAGAGVAGVTAVRTVMMANPDGHTLMAVVPSFTYMEFMIKDSPVRATDLEPITLLSHDPYLISVFPGLPAKSIKEFIALAKSKPGTLNVGSGNIGSGTHLMTMLFLSSAGIRNEVTYVPYKGTGLAFGDLMAGRLQGSLTSIVSAGPHVKFGKLRGLAVTSGKRSEIWPDIPTVAEQGVPGFDAVAWYGLAAPLKTPTAIINKLAAASKEAANSPQIRDKLQAMGGTPVGSSPAEFKKMIEREVPRWRKLLAELQIKFN